MARQMVTRQKIRRGLIIVVFLSFPLIYHFFSPVDIIHAATEGIINGSLVVFGLLFLSSLLLGRAWCAWVCPGAGLQEAVALAQDKPAPGGRWDWIKWGIWIPWIGGIATAAITAGGYRTVNVLYRAADTFTEEVIPSTDLIRGYVIYFTVVGLIVILSLAAGRRGFCHYACWMAPFMIIGRKIRNLVKWPAFRLKAAPDQCIQCKSDPCTRNCPMSLQVQQLVQRGNMEHSECILCGACIDTCPKNAIRYSFSAGDR